MAFDDMKMDELAKAIHVGREDRRTESWGNPN